ncbi:MAG: hypothetical protein ACLTDM_04270 [Clostridium butyricum]
MKKIVMSLPIDKYTFSEIDNSTAKVNINVCHEKANPNGSYFELESFELSQESFKNKPLCASYQLDDDGNVEDFKEHNEDEKPCGVIPESNNFKIVDIDGLKWINVDALVFKDYCPEAYALLKDGKKISMEIEVTDGFKGTDGFYHIKNFNLLCVTLLGDEYAPAMGKNSTITLYNEEVSEQFALTFSAIINKANQLVAEYSATEGGQLMNRDEIIKKFAAFSNVEGYSAIIENDSLSDEELETQLFTLSNNQIRESIRETLSAQKIIKTYWDGEAYEISKYYLEDMITDENLVIAYSREDYKFYGIPYTLSGDKAELNFSESKRYVIGDWRPYSEGETESTSIVETFANEIIEAAKNEIDKVKESFNVKETEEYKTLENDLQTVQTELKDTKASFVDLQTENENLKTEKEALATDNEKLKEFKLSKDKEEKDAAIEAVLSKFTSISETEEYKNIFEKRYEFSLSDLEKELKVVAYDNGESIKNTKKFKKESNNSYKLDNDSDEEDYSKFKSVWDEEFAE